MSTAKSLLLVIDVQNGFVGQATATAVPRIQALLIEAKALSVLSAFSKYQNYAGSPYFRFLNWRKLTTDIECDLHPEVVPFAQNVFPKNCYSALTKEFLAFLQAEQIKTVYLCGVDTDCCVLTTAVQLFEMGLRAVVLEHYCASNGGAASHEAALKVLERLIGGKHILHGEQSLSTLNERAW